MFTERHSTEMFLCSHPPCDLHRILWCLEVERSLSGRSLSVITTCGSGRERLPFHIRYLSSSSIIINDLLINLPSHRWGGAMGNLMSFSFMEGKFLIYWLLSDLLSTQTFFNARYFRSVLIQQSGSGERLPSHCYFLLLTFIKAVDV